MNLPTLNLVMILCLFGILSSTLIVSAAPESTVPSLLDIQAILTCSDAPQTQTSEESEADLEYIFTHLEEGEGVQYPFSTEIEARQLMAQLNVNECGHGRIVELLVNKDLDSLNRLHYEKIKMTQMTENGFKSTGTTGKSRNNGKERKRPTSSNTRPIFEDTVLGEMKEMEPTKDEMDQDTMDSLFDDTDVKEWMEAHEEEMEMAVSTTTTPSTIIGADVAVNALKDTDEDTRTLIILLFCIGVLFLSIFGFLVFRCYLSHGRKMQNPVDHV